MLSRLKSEPQVSVEIDAYARILDCVFDWLSASNPSEQHCHVGTAP